MPDRPRPRADQDKTKQQWRLMARDQRAAVCLLTLGKAAGRHGGNRSRAPIPLPLRHGTFHTYARAAAGRAAPRTLCDRERGHASAANVSRRPAGESARRPRAGMLGLLRRRPSDRRIGARSPDVPGARTRRLVRPIVRAELLFLLHRPSLMSTALSLFCLLDRSPNDVSTT